MKNRLFIVLNITFILMLVMCHIDKLNSIRIIGDEFGYWVNAAFLTGRDWADIASLNSYYSYGYSLFLIPIMHIMPNAVLAYKMAIALNGCFMVISYLLALKVGKSLYPDMEIKIIALYAMIMQTFPTLVLLSQHTVGECLQYMLYWAIVYSFIKVSSKISPMNILILNLELVLLFVTHMRNLAVVLVGFAFQIFQLGKNVYKKDKKTVRIFLIIFAGGILLFFSIKMKDFLSRNLYRIGEGVVSVNDFNGQVGKLSYIFTGEGLIDLVSNYIGFLFNSAATSFLITLYAFFIAICCIKRFFINKEVDKTGLVYCLVFLCFLGEVAIAAVFTLRGVRMDALVYGRYYDQVVCPLIFLSLLHIRKKGISVIHYIRMIVFFLIMGVLTYAKMSQKEPIFYSGVTPVLGGLGYFTNTINTPEIIYITVLCIIGLVGLLFIVKRNVVQKYIVIVMSVFWLVCVFKVLNVSVYNNPERYLHINEVAAEIKNSEKNIYYINERTAQYVYIDYLQFALWDKKICLIDKESIQEIKDAYIVVDNNSSYAQCLHTKKQPEFETIGLDIFYIQ